MEYHEYANIFPMMNEHELAALVESMRTNGFDETCPVVMYDGKVLDGRNRIKAATMAGKVVSAIQYEGNDPLGYVLRHNLTRRHLTESQRAAIGAKLAILENHRPSKSANLPTYSQDNVSEMLNVSSRSIRDVKSIDREAPELVHDIESGELNINQAKKIINEQKQNGGTIEEAKYRFTEEQIKQAGRKAFEDGESILAKIREQLRPICITDPARKIMANAGGLANAIKILIACIPDDDKLVQITDAIKMLRDISINRQRIDK